MQHPEKTEDASRGGNSMGFMWVLSDVFLSAFLAVFFFPPRHF